MENNNDKNKSTKDYIRYSGIATQMAVTIALGAWAGSALDKHFGSPRPYFTAALTLIFLFAALYLALKDLIFKK